MTNEQMAEVMIEKFIGHINLWEEADKHLDYRTQRSYFTAHTASVIGHGEETRIVHLWCAVEDELGACQLLGVFEEEVLVHLTSEVDTEWREVGYAEFPSGFIGPENPWKRSWKYTNLP